MSWVRKILHRGEEMDREIEEELRFHIDSRIDRYIRSGMSPEQARVRALDRFGNFERVRDAVREIDLSILRSVSQDIRYGVRTLGRSPGLTAVAVLSLALGIGLNTAIFSVINAVLLRPLPYANADRLAAIGSVSKRYPTSPSISPANFHDWQLQNTVFDAMACVDIFGFGNYGRVSLTGAEQSAEIQGLRVSSGFFQVLGVQPMLGRTFTPDDDRVNARIVVLSFKLWQRAFAGDRAVLGRVIGLDDARYTVVGVMPEQFRYRQFTPEFEADLWVPGVFQDTPVSNRAGAQLRAIARLRPGVSMQQANAEIAVISRRLSAAFPKHNQDMDLRAIPLLESISGQQRPSLLLFLGAVTLVLLIACANVASLLMARAGVRQREIAIRKSIGAGRLRLVRQLLTESLLLAFTGALVGIGLAFAGIRLLTLVLPETVFRLDESNIDLRVLAFTMGLCLVSAILFGLAPAVQASRTELADVLRESACTVTAGLPGSRLRGVLVALQVAMSLTLLAGAGLMMNTLWRLHQNALGFDPHNVLTMQCILPKSPRYVTNQGLRTYGPVELPTWTINRDALDFVDEVADRLEKLPEIESAAGSIAGLPFRRTLGDRFQIDGRPGPPDGYVATKFGVTPGYFRALRVPLLAGREFNPHDDPDAPRVAIINRTMARKFWPGLQNPLGQRIICGLQPQPYRIVGIVDDIRLWPARPAEPQMYFSQAQMGEPQRGVGINLRLELYFVVHTRSAPATTEEAVIRLIHGMDPSVSVSEVQTMDAIASKALAPRRATMLLLAFFASIAILLAAIGIYGVIAHAVTVRRHEVGIRMALGASHGDIVRLLIRNGLLLSLAGIAIGLAGSYWLMRLLTSQLYGIAPSDPVTLGVVALALLVVALASSYWPARRAARSDPISALRCD